jgi:hypothetical protein
MDPRMPTIWIKKKRHALFVSFVIIGVAKREKCNVSLLEFCLREDLNKTVE